MAGADHGRPRAGHVRTDNPMDPADVPPADGGGASAVMANRSRPGQASPNAPYASQAPSHSGAPSPSSAGAGNGSQARRGSFVRDPFLLREYRRMLSEHGNARLSLALAGMLVSGVIEGLVFLLLIPATRTLATGEMVWGLGISDWLGVLVLLALLGAISTYFMNLTAYQAALDALRVLLVRVGDQLARLPLGWFGPGLNGRISRLASDGLMAVGSGVAHYTVPIIRNVVAAFTLLVGVLCWKPWLGVVLALMLLTVAGMSLLSNRLEKASQRCTEGPEKELASRIVEYASCQSALRSAGRSASYAPLFDAVAGSARAQRRGLWISTAALVVAGISAQLTVVVVITVSAQLALGGTLDPVATVVFMGVALRFMRNLQDATSFLVATEGARTQLADIHEMLDAPLLPVPSRAPSLPQPGEVVLEHVSFSYVPDRPVLQDLNFTVPPHTMTAIVGPSGSGKTTVFKLLARFWDVDSGAVRVGGQDVRDQTTAQLMGQLSMVFQDVYLYDDTLLENIRVGREGASDAQVLRAAEMAGCADIAARLPQGWHTRVGEGGGRLSGGERQRVSIARALLKGAPILLFDEATSALDPENEARVQQVIETLRRRATVLVIAHKLDTVRNADQIIVLDAQGRISQVGTHAELAAVEGLYRRFLKAREDAAGWSLGQD